MLKKVIAISMFLLLFGLANSQRFSTESRNNEIDNDSMLIEENTDYMLKETYLENYNCIVRGKISFPFFRFRKFSLFYLMQDMYIGSYYIDEYGNKWDSPGKGYIWTSGTSGVIEYTGSEIFGQLGGYNYFGFMGIQTRHLNAMEKFRGITFGNNFYGFCSHVKIGTLQM